MVLSISEIKKLGDNTSIITGTGPRRRTVKLQPIYDALGENKVQALRGFHTISGCDTTGHIFRTSKTSSWKIFLKSDNNVIRSLTALGKGPEPTEEVLEGCGGSYSNATEARPSTAWLVAGGLRKIQTHSIATPTST